MCVKIEFLEVKVQLPHIYLKWMYVKKWIYKSECIILDLYYTIFEYEMKIWIRLNIYFIYFKYDFLMNFMYLMIDFIFIFILFDIFLIEDLLKYKTLHSFQFLNLF